MSKVHKYVRHSVVGFVIWPKTDSLWHSEVGQLLEHIHGEIMSAGFVSTGADGPVCFGESESLGIGSLEGDTEAIRKQFVPSRS